MPTQPDHALGRVEILRTVLGDLREPSTALASREVLVERAESCLDDLVGALRNVRVYVADLESHT
jgi:hypothetical protein